MTAAPTRRIRVDVEISGGRVRMDLTDPTDDQLAAINALLERWLDDGDNEADDDEEPRPTAPPPAATNQPSSPVDTPRLEPIRGESTSAPPATIKRALCGAVDPTSGRKCRRYADHADTEHRWWERNGAHGAWGTAEPEPDAVAIQLGEAAPLADQITEHAATSDRTPTPPGVVLCGCGHGERMHERDELAGRGQCHHAECGCAEYRSGA